MEPELDLYLYAGRWYEMAKVPNPWEPTCSVATVDYYVDDRGRDRGRLPEIDVVHTCTDPDGERTEVVEGKCIPDPRSPAAWRIQWEGHPVPEEVLVHQTDYTHYSVVGSPDRRFLWMYSRSPTMCIHVFEHLLDSAEALGYDVDALDIVEARLVDCPYGPAYDTDLPRSRSYSPDTPIPTKILTKVKHTSHPVAIVKLSPFLITDSNHFRSGPWTGNKKVDEWINQQMQQDKTRVKRILKYIAISDAALKDTGNFWYETPYFYHVIMRKDKKPLTKENVDAIRTTVDPHDTGPDTWMEGDITLFREEDMLELLGEKKATPFFKKFGDNYAELGVDVEKIYLYDP